MKLSKKLRKKIYGEAQEIGLCILCLGLGENQRPSGFFICGFTATDVAKRIMETYNPFSVTYFAAMDYWKGYQSLLDNTDPWARSNHVYVKRHFDRVKAALSARLLGDLLFSYGCAARVQIERQRQEQLSKRRKKTKKAEPAIVPQPETTDAAQAFV
jgi:hypothetical protein